MRSTSFDPFVDVDLPLTDRRDGKVRSSWAVDDDRRLIVTTDRLSVFDRVVAGVPFKGQVLNELSAWWFDQTADIIDNHLIAVPDPNAMVVRTARPLPVEVVVRGFITGVTDTSLWGMYSTGERNLYGHRLPDGLSKNTPLPEAIVTPTTKAADGGHDMPISCSEVVESGLVDQAVWTHVTDAALALFRVGTDLGRRAGLTLADTKYEFGTTIDGSLILIDEIHTPDSSRWWIDDTRPALVDAGREPESLDKETVRRAFDHIGYRGDGPVPRLPDEVWSDTTTRYIDAYQRLTGASFMPGDYPVGARLIDNLTKAGLM